MYFHVGADGAHSVVAVQEPVVVGPLSTGENHITCNLLLAFCPFIHHESISQPRDCRPPEPGGEKFAGALADTAFLWVWGWLPLRIHAIF